MAVQSISGCMWFQSELILWQLFLLNRRSMLVSEKAPPELVCSATCLSLPMPLDLCSFPVHCFFLPSVAALPVPGSSCTPQFAFLPLCPPPCWGRLFPPVPEEIIRGGASTALINNFCSFLPAFKTSHGRKLQRKIAGISYRVYYFIDMYCLDKAASKP